MKNKTRLETFFQMPLTDIRKLPHKCQACLVANICRAKTQPQAASCKLDDDYRPAIRES